MYLCHLYQTYTPSIWSGSMSAGGLTCSVNLTPYTPCAPTLSLAVENVDFDLVCDDMTDRIPNERAWLSVDTATQSDLFTLSALFWKVCRSM